ncbi:hypothetical protein C8R46DRAFT_911118, partial [Mycena filopes]
CTTHCAPGTFISGTSCSACPAGYSSGADATACSPCGPNTYSTNGGSASCGALTCTSGQFLSGNFCGTCSAGTFSAAGDSSCTPCAANSFSNADGASACTTCPSGTKSAAYITGTTCTSCSPGTFASGADSAVCAACPEDTWSEYGATFHLGTKCYDCPRNFYGAGGFAGCLPCPRGKQSSPGSATCTASPSPSHRHTRAAPQEVMACPAFQQLCPVMTGSKSFECVDTQSSLESCGGCVGAMPSTGQDCSVIPNVNAVSCSMGRCVVTECRKNYVVSAEGDSCVKKTKGHRKRGYFF